MRIRMLLLSGALFAAGALFAQEMPRILSVAPMSAPTSGGTTVEILGSGFASDCGLPITCLQSEVYFGDVRAAQTHVESDTRITAVTPPHVPGRYDVTYVSPNGVTARFGGTFEFTGPVPQNDFARVLLPIFTPPVHGAFGSEFRTELRLTALVNLFPVYGLRRDPASCAPVLCLDLPDPIRFTTNDDIGPAFPIYDGNPGRFLVVPREQLKNGAMNLRVADVSRAAQNFGTEIPIVADTDFRTTPFQLLGVPSDRRFRNTLRIYSIDASSVTVTIEGRAPVNVPLSPSTSIFEPRYAVFTDFPAGVDPVSVTIAPPPPINTTPPSGPYSVWAFVSVTNNETQMITTITPQP